MLCFYYFFSFMFATYCSYAATRKAVFYCNKSQNISLGAMNILQDWIRKYKTQSKVQLENTLILDVETGCWIEKQFFDDDYRNKKLFF